MLRQAVEWLDQPVGNKKCDDKEYKKNQCLDQHGLLAQNFPRLFDGIRRDRRQQDTADGLVLRAFRGRNIKRLERCSLHNRCIHLDIADCLVIIGGSAGRSLLKAFHNLRCYDGFSLCNSISILDDFQIVVDYKDSAVIQRREKR